MKQTPFHIKGQSYIGHMAWVEEEYPGGRDTYLRDLKEPAMSAFFEQQFFAHAWYDFWPLVEAGNTCAVAMKMQFQPFIHYRARYQARLDIGGIYKIILKLASQNMIARKLPQMITQYFDFTQAELKETAPGYIHFALPGVPMMFVPWMNSCIGGYIDVVLPASGAKTLKITERGTRQTGDAKGFAVGTLEMDVRWT